MTERNREHDEQDPDPVSDLPEHDRSSAVEALLEAMRRANQIIAQLQRRARDVQAIPDTETRSGLTAKHHRVQAVRGAYLDALAAACRRLDISPPRGGDRASQAEIYRVEAALRQGGLEVRMQAPETAAH